MTFPFLKIIGLIKYAKISIGVAELSFCTLNKLPERCSKHLTSFPNVEWFVKSATFDLNFLGPNNYRKWTHVIPIYGSTL